MDPTPSAAPRLPPRQYHVTKSNGLHATGWLIGGGLAVLVIIIRFVLLLAASEPGHNGGGGTGSGLVGALGAFAVLGIARGVSLLRRPVRATLDPSGITIDGLISRKHIAWHEVARIQRDDDQTELMGQNKYRVLTLLDERNRKLGRITDDFAEFDQLGDEIAQRTSAARGAATFDADADRRRRLRNQRRNARWMAAGSALLMLLGIAATAWGVYEWRIQRQLDRWGADARATVDRHYLRRVTGWIDFSFTDQSGVRHTRSTALDKSFWDTAGTFKFVAVRYLPWDPETNRIPGESSGDSPIAMIVGGVVLSVLFGAFPAMFLLGIADIKIRNGKLKLVRLGELDELEPAPPPPAPQPQQAPQFPLPDMSRIAMQAPAVGMPPRRRAAPAGIIAIGWLNIVFGLLGLMCNAGRTLFGLRSRQEPLVIGDQIIFAVETWRIAWFVADMTLGVLLLVSGIGLLRLKPWGRRLALLAAGVQALSSILWIGAGIYDAVQVMPTIPEEEKTRAIAQVIAAIAGAVIGMIYPIVVLIALGRKSAADAFRDRSDDADDAIVLNSPP